MELIVVEPEHGHDDIVCAEYRLRCPVTTIELSRTLVARHLDLGLGGGVLGGAVVSEVVGRDERGEDGEDDDDDEQLNEREAAARASA